MVPVNAWLDTREIHVIRHALKAFMEKVVKKNVNVKTEVIVIRLVDSVAVKMDGEERNVIEVRVVL